MFMGDSTAKLILVRADSEIVTTIFHILKYIVMMGAYKFRRGLSQRCVCAVDHVESVDQDARIRSRVKSMTRAFGKDGVSDRVRQEIYQVVERDLRPSWAMVYAKTGVSV